jgi:lycopene beta-cyclase
MSDAADVLIAGGGLAGCLIALALRERQPGLKLLLVEPGESLGGNHIWSFFDSDVAAEHRWLVEPLICHRWDGYEVRFPRRHRVLRTPYNSIESERLDQLVRTLLPPGSIVCEAVEQIHDGHILTRSGRKLAANQIIDARGPGDLATLDLGWQKFVGLTIDVSGGHGLTRPIVMDATVEQLEGYRFIYCLPFDARTVFIEDTYYADTPDLDIPLIRERIIAYAAAKGWQTNGGGREETGVLPVTMGGDFERYWHSTPGNAKAGVRAGLFHGMTGYSLPEAVRLAVEIADGRPLDHFSRARSHWRGQGYYRMLGKMLFRAGKSNQRYRIFERFYGLPEPLIERFYAGQSSMLDRIRILSGKPPVPIAGAIKALLG